MNNLTEITLTATAIKEGDLVGNKDNQKVRFAYNDLIKGNQVCMWMESGIINAPKIQIVFSHNELRKVLDFMLDTPKIINVSIESIVGNGDIGKDNIERIAETMKNIVEGKQVK